MAAQIAEHDGIDGTSPLFSAFVHGRPVTYWTIDGATPRAMPMYRLCEATGSRCEPIDHPIVVGAIPGDEGFSPFGQIFEVAVPEGWSGRIGSVDEVMAAVEGEGLAAPRATSELLHCPIAAADARLEAGDGSEIAPARPVHYEGRQALCFDFTATRPNHAVLPSGELFIRNVYVLRREDETAPLVERAQMVDLDGDGDLNDSNNIFGVGLEDADYTPLWRMVTVTVPAGLPSIETTPAYTSSTDMFDVAPDYTITPLPDRIVDYELTETLINCPLQSAIGSL
ncbi:MAG: hypothetical protein KC619_02395 [Myxococcales bacterium]|nr:hypothetical protein [Myxococcales bacterium]